jgi:hypothetical protein
VPAQQARPRCGALLRQGARAAVARGNTSAGTRTLRPHAPPRPRWRAALQAVHPSGLLLFATAHSICESRFQGPYAAGVQAWAQPTDAMLSGCIQRLQRDEPGRQMPVDALRSVCANASFTDAGARWLNSQALRAVRRAARRARHQGMAVAALDSYGLTKGQCWASERSDGRHYLPIVPLQLHATLRRALSHWGGKD